MAQQPPPGGQQQPPPQVCFPSTLWLKDQHSLLHFQGSMYPPQGGPPPQVSFCWHLFLLGGNSVVSFFRVPCIHLKEVLIPLKELTLHKELILPKVLIPPKVLILPRFFFSSSVGALGVSLTLSAGVHVSTSRRVPSSARRVWYVTFLLQINLEKWISSHSQVPKCTQCVFLVSNSTTRILEEKAVCHIPFQYRPFNFFLSS